MAASTLTATKKLKHGEIHDSPAFPHLIRAADLQPDRSYPGDGVGEGQDGSGFNLNNLRGRLVELSSCRSSACLSLSCTLLLQAQRRSTPVIWISVTRDSFYPPDLAANGIDLSVLPVVWAPDIRSAVRAADQLLRTGAFGLLVIDLYRNPRLPTPLQARLARLAHHHGCAVCFLTVKPEPSPSLGSMISLFARVSRSRTSAGRFRLDVQVVKDKRRAPVWRHVEHVDGPPGLC
jgi:recombination protein RecA